jgi:putative ABC transport system permease protein
VTDSGLRSSGLSWRFWRRQIRHESAIAIAIFFTSLLAVTLVSAAPRVLEHAAVADVRAALTEATPEERSIRFQLEGRVGARTQAMPFTSLDLRNDELLEQHVPASVAASISDRQRVYESPLFRVRSFPEQADGSFPTTFRFRYQQGIEEQLTVVRGRLPETAVRVAMLIGPDCPTDGTAPEDYELDVDLACRVFDLPVFETAVTQQTASDMMVDVGDRVTLTPATEDTAWMRAPTVALRALLVVEISGIIELTDPSDEYWFEDSSLHRPSITLARFGLHPQLVGAAGLLMPQQYRQFLQNAPSVDNRYTWRYIVAPELVTSADAERFARDVERISPDGYITHALLPELLGEHIAQRRLAVQLISTSAAGMYWVTIAAIVALALLGAVRQRSATGLVIDRGASPRQLRVNAARTALLVVGLPAVVGWTIAWRSFPATSSGPSTRSAIALAVGAFVSIVVTSVPIAPKGVAGERDRRRLVVEIMIIVAAVGSVILLRQRASVNERVDGGLDLLLITAPALVALAAGVLAARFVGPVALAGAAFGSRRRTLGPFVGFRRLVVQPPVARTPVIVMTIAVATAVLSSVLASSVASGQQTAAWQLVGGDYRVQSFVDGVPLPVGLDMSVATDRLSVSGAEVANQRVGEGSRAATVNVVAIDASPYRAMLNGSGLTDVGLDELADGATHADVVPVVAVGRWPIRAAPVFGEQSMLTVESFDFMVGVVAVVDRFPGLTTGRATLLMDLDALGAATNDRVSQPTFVVLDGEDGQLSEIAEYAADRGALAVVTSRFDRLDAIAGDPLSTWTNRSLWAVTAISLIFVAVAAVSAAAIAAGTRRRDLALLRVLGLRPRESRPIAAIEHVPSVVSALAVGGVAGIITGVLLEPVLGLSAFGDGTAAVDVKIDGVAIAGLIVIAGLAAGLGIAISQRITGNGEGARMLKVGDP